MDSKHTHRYLSVQHVHTKMNNMGPENICQVVLKSSEWHFAASTKCHAKVVLADQEVRREPGSKFIISRNIPFSWKLIWTPGKSSRALWLVNPGHVEEGSAFLRTLSCTGSLTQHVLQRMLYNGCCSTPKTQRIRRTPTSTEEKLTLHSMSPGTPEPLFSQLLPTFTWWAI